MLVLVVLVAAWMLYYHNEWVANKAPKGGWVQGAIKHLGKAVPEEVPEDEDPDNTKNEIPVKVAEAKIGTVRKVRRRALGRWCRGRRRRIRWRAGRALRHRLPGSLRRWIA